MGALGSRYKLRNRRVGPPLRQRFEANYTPEPFSGCWLWTGAYFSTGYGALSINNQNARAHRVSWELNRGPIPQGLLVCHKCDTPACVNPDHLFLGTNLDNQRDMIAKGRADRTNHFPKTCGSNHPPARLTENDVIEIRNSSETNSVLALRFGLGVAHVGNIIARRIWRCIPETELEAIIREEKRTLGRSERIEAIAMARQNPNRRNGR